MEQFDGSAGLRVVFVAALVGGILLSAIGAPVSARPPPHAVCGVCSDTLVDAAAENGVAIDLVESSLSIRIDRSGAGHWTARVTLTGSGIETLQENQSLRDRVVQRVYERGYVAVEEPTSLTTSMNGETLVIEYEVPDMAHQSAGGVYVVDLFYWHGGEARWFYLAAWQGDDPEAIQERLGRISQTFSKRNPSGGCKHLRRTDLEIRSGNVPRPDGRLPETTDVVEQLSTEIQQLNQEIEEREDRRQTLAATVAVIEEFSSQ